LVGSFSQHVLAISFVVQAEDAQYVVAAAAITFLPVGHAALTHVFLSEQQRAAVAPVIPYFVGSLNLPAAHVTVVAARHLPAMFSQHVAESAEVHANPAQYVVAAAAFCFNPALHAIVEHSALFVQQLNLPALSPYFAEALYWQVGQVTETPLHFISSFTQQVLKSVPTVQAAPAQYVVAAAAMCFMPALHARESHFAASVQQTAAVVPAVLYLAVSLNLPVGQATVTPPHLVVSVTQHVLATSVVVQARAAQYVVA
jgi:organic hydroperoxide reductase OsmC/OhrA